ncbi:gtpase imap family member gimd1 [Limosa lapponica baueri]|uniref:Gtpase imap family member gimd1 n=1 Tax=Limosa lapponica baueri TaxID=1758121 RepID=A0A2I0TEI2_LIMLA|nr:gtpase imap family member gimd1 [Limosa lapponica baueri]
MRKEAVRDGKAWELKDDTCLNYHLARRLAQLDAIARIYAASDVMRGITLHRNSPMKSTELDCDNLTKELLGPTWKDFTAVLLTHADKAEEGGLSEEAYIRSASSTLLSLLSSVQHRYIFLDNQKSIIKEERAIVLRKLLNFIRQNNYQVLLLKHSKEQN